MSKEGDGKATQSQQPNVTEERQAPEASKKHLDIAWSSLTYVKAGQEDKRLKQPDPTREQWANLKRQPSGRTGNARNAGDRAKPHCPSTRKIVEKLSRHPAA